ncbi:Flagellar motility protein MotE, a chaperone for MotC folding [Monaibacterium marinum]|uniref:Flagellar motility protein MotE, a chaperone for MotC folding n=1 Tax=Pontivivens marinum TaxID=1690039 RepID=A0A2C9CT28_9RHOB|nr:hypothetical protein [Monaibacterium marinum]SOH94388.1 Flagellar motility protein MotE, a chaperone for MotC folding [Monaibacterium marinum]
MNVKRTPALLVLIGIFAASAGLRIAAEGPNWAHQFASFVPSAHANPTEETMPEPDGDAFLQALQRRDAELDARAAQMDARSQQLSTAQASLRNQIAELERAEADLRDTLALASGAADNDVARLVTVYESMRAATAAPLFEAMEPSFAAGFLMRMEPEAAGQILSELSPERAYALSAVMAGRHSAVVRQ